MESPGAWQDRRAPRAERAAFYERLPPTAGELERDDAGAPGPEQDHVLREVLLRVPESAVVARVDGEVAVVAPAALDLGLRPRAGVGDLLRLGHLARRVARRSAGVANRGIVVRPGSARAAGG